MLISTNTVAQTIIYFDRMFIVVISRPFGDTPIDRTPHINHDTNLEQRRNWDAARASFLPAKRA